MARSDGTSTKMESNSCTSGRENWDCSGDHSRQKFLLDRGLSGGWKVEWEWDFTQWEMRVHHKPTATGDCSELSG